MGTHFAVTSWHWPFDAAGDRMQCRSFVLWRTTTHEAYPPYQSRATAPPWGAKLRVYFFQRDDQLVGLRQEHERARGRRERGGAP